MFQDHHPEDDCQRPDGECEQEPPHLEEALTWPIYRLKTRRQENKEKPGPDFSSPGSRNPG